jgi:hypothetical protein
MMRTEETKEKGMGVRAIEEEQMRSQIRELTH